MSPPRHHANSSRTLFQNPWQLLDEPDDTALEPSVPNVESQEQSWWSTFTSNPPFLSSVSSLLTGIPLERAKDYTGNDILPTKVVAPDFKKSENTQDKIKATWLGHASFLVEMPIQKGSTDPVRILLDPMFSDRAGPSQWAGIRRRLPPPCTIGELPDFQFVLISHNHYDHLDLPTIDEIVRMHGENVTFLVPLGLKEWFLTLGLTNDRVYELDWWDEIVLPVPCEKTNSPESDQSSSSTFICVPAQHTSGRSFLDKCTSLWCGWVIKQEPGHSNASVYHAGDTGYIGANGACPVFNEIGERHGPVDLAMLPIWRGGTLSFISQLGLRLTHHPLLSSMHASPVDAVAIHRDVRARHSLAMHFGTFAGSEAEAIEPLVELGNARREAKLGDWWEEGGIGAIDVGETAEVCILEEQKSHVATADEVPGFHDAPFDVKVNTLMNWRGDVDKRVVVSREDWMNMVNFGGAVPRAASPASSGTPDA